ncbi:MAG: S-layer homology domain-containing protein, partial [Clostridiales bacterium]|nr:S-layer homology domain-containing protein [Clostridiales bacterium]
MKKIIAVFLTAILLFALASNALAAPVSFPDVRDEGLAREVAVLQMLGAVGGDGNGNFVPNGTLTRAAFCKMAVITMGRGGEEALYKNRTIFRDVRAGHWARGYINIAVTGENRIMAGSGGYFMPDTDISFAEAVTILVRMLGYTDADAGMLWPDGYMALAHDTGLTAGMAVSSWTAPISRAQAAHLFFNLLGTPKKGGGSYISSLGTTAENVVITELGVRASDGTANAIRTFPQGIVKSASGIVPPVILGQRGTLLTDKSGKALAFLPDRNSKTISVSQITAAWIKDPDGVRYDIDTKAPAYTASEDEDFGNMHFKIAIGSKVTIFYSADGKIESLFVNTSKADGAIVAGASASVGSFGWLTGGDTGYKILKNGAPASMSDIRQYDVVTYDKSGRILNVTDFRLTGCYENCWPNLSSPSKITVMGHEFPVLPSAIDSLAQYKLGQVITLLLTTDNQVAGAATGVSGSTAVGIVSDITASKATVKLLNGLELTGDPRLTDSAAAQYAGELVTVSSNTTGQISHSKLG